MLSQLVLYPSCLKASLNSHMAAVFPYPLGAWRKVMRWLQTARFNSSIKGRFATRVEGSAGSMSLA